MPPRRDLSDLAAALGRSCAAGHRPLYLPEAYAKLTAHRIVIINTAVSGGSFEEHLREVISLYGGSQHIALDVQLLRMCFSLPATTGLGEPLTPEELDTLLHAQGPAVFFSRTCAPGTLPVHEAVRRSSFCSTMPERCGKSCGWDSSLA